MPTIADPLSQHLSGEPVATQLGDQPTRETDEPITPTNPNRPSTWRGSIIPPQKPQVIKPPTRTREQTPHGSSYSDIKQRQQEIEQMAQAIHKPITKPATAAKDKLKLLPTSKASTKRPKESLRQRANPPQQNQATTEGGAAHFDRQPTQRGAAEGGELTNTNKRPPPE